MKKPFILSSFLLILFTISAFCQNHQDTLVQRTYTALRTEHPPRIDGVLDDACWTEGEWHGDFIQQVPNESELPSSPTEIKILYTTHSLYVAIRCYDAEPEKIHAIFSGRDHFAGDMTGIALDSYDDNKTAFEFNLSAAGQKIDLKHKGDYEFDLNWDAVWEGRTGREDSAWTAEMRIPFSQLRYSDREEQQWGMHIWRWIDRKNEESQWTLIPINAPAMVFRFGELNGIKDIRTSRQIELLPYGVSKFSPTLSENANPYGKTREWYLTGGFDAKIGLSSNFTLDATINPDFGQVEADPSVLNLTAYETFYDEKRPFFLESREIFDYNINENRIYYSRRVGQRPGYVPGIDEDHYLEIPQNTTIMGAAKITGKTRKGLSVGIMESMTSAEYAKVFRPDRHAQDTLVAPYSNFMVARIMQEKNKGNTLFGGIFSTNHQLAMDSRIASQAHGEAYSGGLDFEHNFADKTYYVGGKMIFSHLRGSQDALQSLQESNVHLFQRPDAEHLNSRYDSTRTTLSGTGGYLSGGKKGGKWRFNEQFSWLSPGLDLNDLGYLRQADVISQSTDLSFRETEAKKFSRHYSLSLYQSTSYSYGGELTAAQMGLGMENQFHNLWGISLNWSAALPVLDTRELRGGPALRINARNEFAAHMNSNRSKDLNFAGGIHYSLTHTEDSRNFASHLELSWQPVSRIRLTPFILYAHHLNDYQYIKTLDLAGGPAYMMGSLDQRTLEFTFRAELFLTAEMSLQFYGSPYYSVGHYSRFYLVDDAGAKENSERYIAVNESISSLSPENTYTLQDELTAPLYQFDNPDFMFGQLRTNLIFRWEYLPGSVLYLVWTHNKTSNENIYLPTLNENFSNLNETSGENIWLIKLNYWFSL